MKKNNTSKFIEGTVAGLVLGVAGALFLSSKTGKAMQENVKSQMADFYKYIAPKVKKMKKMGEKEYKSFMHDAVRQYGKAKKISEKTTQELIKEVQKSWGHFSKHLGK